MGMSLVTAPTAEPVSIAEARAQCNVTHSLDDAVFAALILSAREWAQGFTGRAFMAQTWDAYYDCFPWDAIELPYTPVTSVTSITYTDAAGATQTLSSAVYELNQRSLVPRIRPKSGYAWPSTKDVYNAVTVRFVAGYDANHPDLMAVRAAMLLHVEAHYDRDSTSFDNLMSAAEALLSPLRIIRF